MALYHFSVKTVSRGGGRSAVAAAAYRCADVLHDERTGQTHDYERKRGVEATMLLMPDGVGGLATMEGEGWTAERERLWNAAEAAEKRKDGRVGREYELALPCELDEAGRRRLVRTFAGELVKRFGVAVDAAIHAPGREGDQRNWHAHVLTTTRRATAEGLGEKAEIELSDTARAKRGLGSGATEIEGLRAVWAGQVNQALERARVAERVDHRSYARQGRDLVATQHMGPRASGVERRAEREQVEEQEATGVPQAVSAPTLAPAVLERPQEAPGRPQEATRATQEPEGWSQAPQAPTPVPERPQATRTAAVGPVTRIGQHNAGVRERNRLVAAAREAWEAARARVERLERAAAAGMRWVRGLARGIGEQEAAERAARERETERQRQELAQAEAARRAERERQEAARLAEREQIAAELRRKAELDELARRAVTPVPGTPRPRLTPEQWDGAAYWKGLAEEGRKLRQVDRERQGQKSEQERPREREGPSLGR